MDKERILTATQTYLDRNRIETERLKSFIEFLHAHDAVLSRANTIGHITTSAIVFDSNKCKILLIAHKFLGRLLQPGGHYENDESLLMSAAREVHEETGIPYGSLIAEDKTDIPFDIDTHIIPANQKKGEPEHYHFDFRYIFHTDGFISVSLQENEVTDYGWFSVRSEEARQGLGDYLVAKLLLNYN